MIKFAFWHIFISPSFLFLPFLRFFTQTSNMHLKLYVSETMLQAQPQLSNELSLLLFLSYKDEEDWVLPLNTQVEMGQASMWRWSQYSDMWLALAGFGHIFILYHEIDQDPASSLCFLFLVMQHIFTRLDSFTYPYTGANQLSRPRLATLDDVTSTVPWSLSLLVGFCPGQRGLVGVTLGPVSMAWQSSLGGQCWTGSLSSPTGFWCFEHMEIKENYNF